MVVDYVRLRQCLDLFDFVIASVRLRSGRRSGGGFCSTSSLDLFVFAAVFTVVVVVVVVEAGSTSQREGGERVASRI